MKSNKQLSLVALCLGFFMVIIDATIINVALPNLLSDLKGDVSWLQWILDGYTLTFACLLLLAGTLSDRIGAKTAYLSGLSLFVLSSFACGMSENFPMLTCFRLLQGISAALLVPTSVALISAAYPDKTERAKAMGVWASVAGIAAAAGPLLGAVLTALWGWRAVFFVNLPVGLIAIGMTFHYVLNPPKSDPQVGFDILGQLLGIVSIAALAFGLIEAGRLGWTSSLVLGSFVLFVLTLILFIQVESSVKFPMFPLSFFKSKVFSVSMLVGMMINVGFYGQLFLLPLYFQQLRGYSVLMTALAIFPQTALVPVSAYISGKVTSRVGYKLPMLIGLPVAAVGFFSLLAIDKQSPAYFCLILPLVLIGCGISFTMPASTIALMNSVPSERAGLASGAFNTSRQIGSLMGVAIYGTFLNTAPNFITGMHWGFLLGGIGLLLSAFFVWKAFHSSVARL